MLFLRRRGAHDEPHEVAIGISPMGGKIFSG
jgi:hypothetical protein